ncbi:hypothetical protein Cadr_000013287 [Camelus dromedarius]|uniref:Uncharacterized protein n=1 Tax=Camelus dromedarius TaxID=9838 RepID=A0A5N4DDZ1_CAMDR|nr:hypothetical protein Cadr_000013287 [Camelus dromedarius]
MLRLIKAVLAACSEYFKMLCGPEGWWYTWTSVTQQNSLQAQREQQPQLFVPTAQRQPGAEQTEKADAPPGAVPVELKPDPTSGWLL